MSNATYPLAITDHQWQVYKLTDIAWPSIRNPRHQNADDATYSDPVPLVCTNFSYESGGRSVGATPTYYFDFCITINKCIWIKYVSSHVINYQHVSIAFAIIVRVVIQEYEEYNNLPHWISGTIQYYNKCHKLRVISLTHFGNLLYS